MSSSHVQNRRRSLKRVSPDLIVAKLKRMEEMDYSEGELSEMASALLALPHSRGAAHSPPPLLANMKQYDRWDAHQIGVGGGAAASQPQYDTVINASALTVPLSSVEAVSLADAEEWCLWEDTAVVVEETSRQPFTAPTSRGVDGVPSTLVTTTELRTPDSAPLWSVSPDSAASHEDDDVPLVVMADESFEEERLHRRLAAVRAEVDHMHYELEVQCEAGLLDSALAETTDRMGRHDTRTSEREEHCEPTSRRSNVSPRRYAAPLRAPSLRREACPRVGSRSDTVNSGAASLSKPPKLPTRAAANVTSTASSGGGVKDSPLLAVNADEREFFLAYAKSSHCPQMHLAIALRKKMSGQRSINGPTQLSSQKLSKGKEPLTPQPIMLINNSKYLSRHCLGGPSSSPVSADRERNSRSKAPSTSMSTSALSASHASGFASKQDSAGCQGVPRSVSASSRVTSPASSVVSELKTSRTPPVESKAAVYAGLWSPVKREQAPATGTPKRSSVLSSTSSTSTSLLPKKKLRPPPLSETTHNAIPPSSSTQHPPDAASDSRATLVAPIRDALVTDVLAPSTTTPRDTCTGVCLETASSPVRAQAASSADAATMISPLTPVVSQVTSEPNDTIEEIPKPFDASTASPVHEEAALRLVVDEIPIDDTHEADIAGDDESSISFFTEDEEG